MMKPVKSKEVKLSYSEGTVFLVPLRTGGYARGIIARASQQGTLFGYFFGPHFLSPELVTFDDIEPEKAILKARFGDLGFMKGEWQIRGQLANWDRSKWPMPDFIRKDPLGIKKPVVVRYSDIDPSQREGEFPAPDGVDLANDSLSGYKAVEIKLGKILSA